MKENIVLEKAFNFALKSIDLYKQLLQVQEYVLSKQFVRSSTSIGANIQEAQAAISKRDFIAKISIASKEARETLYWINLLEYGKFLEYDYNDLKEDTEELIKLCTKIVKSSQNSL